MTPEDKKMHADVVMAKAIAVDMGEALVNQAKSGRVAVYTSAIVFAGMCNSAGVGMHQAIDLFMSIYKDMEQFNDGFVQ